MPTPGQLIGFNYDNREKSKDRYRLGVGYRSERRNAARRMGIIRNWRLQPLVLRAVTKKQRVMMRWAY